MKTKAKKKSYHDQELAVKKSQLQQKKIHEKIYAAMHKKLPANIRGVVKKAITAFQAGKVSKKEVAHLLSRNFSDKTFQSILQCVQG